MQELNLLIAQEKLKNAGKCRLEGNAPAPSRDIGQRCIALGEKEFKGGRWCVFLFMLKFYILHHPLVPTTHIGCPELESLKPPQ